MNRNLYDKDYYLWLEEISQLLQDGKWLELDIENLVDEISAMSKSQKRAVYSNLKIILLHLLKYKYQPEKRSNSWLSTIEEHRQRLQEIFEDSPSLSNYFLEIYSAGKCYHDARRLAAKETSLAMDAFPSESPFTPEEILNPEYLPDS